MWESLAHIGSIAKRYIELKVQSSRHLVRWEQKLKKHNAGILSQDIHINVLGTQRATICGRSSVI